MRRIFALLLLLNSLTLLAQIDIPDPIPETISSNQDQLNNIKNITRFAFGSCNNQTQPQPLWRDVINNKPDLWVWGGDVIYADWEEHYDIKASYEKQFKQPDYSELRSKTPIIGIWDDHDFGGDNEDGTNPQKKENQKLFLDFIEEPTVSPRRVQEGIYTSYEYGDADRRIKFIMLDNRYFKGLDPAYPMLGKKQWDWVENELKNSKAKITFIVAGLSVLSPPLPISEEWAEMPMEEDRMLNLLDKYHTKGVVFLTGDKHFSTVFMNWGHLEFLSSGLTHYLTDWRAQWYLRRKFPDTYFGRSYGLIDIEWKNGDPILKTSVRTIYGTSAYDGKFNWVKDKWVWEY